MVALQGLVAAQDVLLDRVAKELGATWAGFPPMDIGGFYVRRTDTHVAMPTKSGEFWQERTFGAQLNYISKALVAVRTELSRDAVQTHFIVKVGRDEMRYAVPTTLLSESATECNRQDFAAFLAEQFSLEMSRKFGNVPLKTLPLTQI